MLPQTWKLCGRGRSRASGEFSDCGRQLLESVLHLLQLPAELIVVGFERRQLGLQSCNRLRLR